MIVYIFSLYSWLNETPTRPYNNDKRQGVREDPKQKTELGTRKRTDRIITLNNTWKEIIEADKEIEGDKLMID
jgi:hypothetical protein